MTARLKRVLTSGKSFTPKPDRIGSVQCLPAAARLKASDIPPLIASMSLVSAPSILKSIVTDFGERAESQPTPSLP